MCFKLHDATKLKPKIAKKDILCVKGGYISRLGFEPYYRDDFKYKVNQQQIMVELIIDECSEIEEGYHAFSILPRPNGLSVTNAQMGLFIIPKGSKYYYNPDRKEIVASSMIYKGWFRSVRYNINYNSYRFNTKLFNQLSNDPNVIMLDKIEIPKY